MPNPSREYIVASAADIPDGTHRVADVGGRKIGIFNIGGQFYALPNLCPHQLGPLCTGKISGTLTADKGSDWKIQWERDGEIVTCPWHGLEYHIPSGQCLAFSEIRLRSYEIWVEDDWVKIRV